MKSQALKSLILYIGFVYFSFALGAALNQDTIDIKGTGLFSFGSDSYMVQTDKYVFKISRDKLPQAALTQLERATTQGQKVALTVPRESLVYLWPVVGSALSGSGVLERNREAKRLVSEAKEHDGRIAIKGTAEYSFTEGYYLVHAGNAVYQVRKSALPQQLRQELARFDIGARVSVDVPQEAVSLVWHYRQVGEKASGDKLVNDEVRVNGRNFSISGTVLYSFSEPEVLVQSDGQVYQLQRSQIVTKRPEALDSPGAKVQLSVPISAVEFAWSADPTELKMNRLPASRP